jgi:hypothetical protein
MHPAINILGECLISIVHGRIWPEAKKLDLEAISQVWESLGGDSSYNCAAGYLLILLRLPPSLCHLFLAAETSTPGVTDGDDGKVAEPRVSARAAVSND